MKPPQKPDGQSKMENAISYLLIGGVLSLTWFSRLP